MTPERDRNGVRYLTPEEVCRMLGKDGRPRSRSYLRKIDRAWPFKLRLSHKVVLYREADFLRWLEMRSPELYERARISRTPKGGVR